MRRFLFILLLSVLIAIGYIGHVEIKNQKQDSSTPPEVLSTRYDIDLNKIDIDLEIYEPEYPLGVVRGHVNVNLEGGSIVVVAPEH